MCRGVTCRRTGTRRTTAVARAIRRALDVVPQSSGTVLELAAGTGRLTRMLRARFPYVIGVPPRRASRQQRSEPVRVPSATPFVRHTLRRVKAMLRAAQPEDAPRISVLLDQLGWVVPPEKVVVELSASPSTEVVVAELDRDVVGLIAVTTRRQFQRAGNLITIDTLVVDERHCSRGIGEQLVGVALEAAARSGAQAVEAVSALRRVEARRFYERLGFEITANYFVRTC
jgi:predicted N-acetyltransferase YhbS